MKAILCSILAGGVITCSQSAWADTNCVPPPSGLLSWWTAEGDGRDLVGANDAALMNGVSFAPGMAGMAFSLDGTNDYIRLPDNLFPVPPIAPATTPFSFETWFKTTSGGVILGQQSGIPFTSPGGWVPGIHVGTDGKLRAQVFWSGSGNPVTTTQSVSDGVFHHVAVTYDGGAEAVYLDGQLLTNRPFTQVSYATSYNYQLGIGYTSGWTGGNGTWFPFKGLIDEAALYNRALTSNEVAAIYAAGAVGKCTSSLPPVFTQQPASFDAQVGSSPTLSVGLRGAAPFAYQWQFAGTNLPAGTNASLTLPNIAAAQGGPYSLFVTNAFGSAQSATGIVTVTFPIALDTVVSNGLPYLGAGNLESAGAQDVYTFDAPASRLAYFDVITALNRLFWSLTAPDGSTVFSGRYMPYDDTRRIELPMQGKYRLVVYNDSGLTGGYSFEIYSVTNQTFTINAGSTVTNGLPAVGAGNLEMPGAFDDYFFAAPANLTVFFDVITAFNRLFWTLTAPDGTAIFANRYMPYDDTGRFDLPMPGTYRLRVFNDDIYTGAYSFKLWTNVDNVFNIAVGDTVTNGAPAVGAGNLEWPGTWDDYLFAAPPNRLVYFDVLSAPFRCFWTFYGPDGAAVFSNNYMPNNNAGRVVLPRSGTYRLRVYSDNASTGTYGFRLTGITDQSFAINIGDTVTNGVPLTGAGNIEMPGSVDDYSFTAPASQVVYFKALSAPFRLFWTLIAPNGAAVFNGYYVPNDNVRRVELPMPGTYHLYASSDQNQTGTYSFKLWSVTDQSFAVNVGDIVTNGVPSTGAGNLEMPGSVDEYRFTAPTNRVVYFDVLSAPYRLWWMLIAPDNSQVFSDLYLPNNNTRRVDLPLAGTYRLRVYSDVDQTGPYSFKLWNVGDQSFAITIGNTVTNGVPVAGAGVLSTPGEDDLFTFTANAGQRVLFDDRDASPRVATWWLVAPGGAGQIFADNLNGGDAGTFTLPVTGTYQIHVRNTTSTTPVNYSFALVDSGTTNASPPTVDAFTLNIGDTISNGVPALGAGSIETTNARDIYTFTTSAGQVVSFQDLGGSVYRQLRYDVYDSQWNLLFGEWIGNDVEIGRRQLTRGGTYYLVASGNNNTATGTYTLKLWPVTDQTFSINIGDTVSSNSPSVGAGVIESPGAQDTYTFTAAPGQVVFFEDRGASVYRQIRYDVYDDRGLFLFGEWLGGATDQDVGWRTLNRGGTYKIVVSANPTVTGTYSFKLWPVTGDQNFAINIGDTVSDGVPGPGAGNLEAPGVRDLYTFTAAPNQEVFFQDLGATPNRQIRYDVFDDRGIALFGEWLGGDSEIGRQTLTRGGTYTIITSAAQNYTGTYSFRLLAATNDQAFAINIGDAVINGFPAAGAGNLSAPGELDTYSFTAAPGQIVFFEDWNASNPGNMRYDVYDNHGTPIFGEWLNGSQDVGRQVLTGGAYKLVVSGYRDTTGTYGFKLWPFTDQSFSLSIGDTISNGVPALGAGNIEVPGARDLYTFTAPPEQLVYFDERAASNPGNLRYDLFDQDWNAIAGEWLGNGQQVGLFRLSRGGTYYLLATGYRNVTGTYNLRLWDALPRILQQPLSARGVVGQGQTFTVKAESPYSINYQWRLYGTNVPGATNVILNLQAPTLGQAGPYDVIVANQNGAVTSVVATLTLDTSELFVNAFAPSGPVNTNVSQLVVQFSSALAAIAFAKRDIQITGPGGPLDSGFFGITQADPQTFNIGIFPQSAEGAYTVTIGPSVTNQAGVSMTGGAFSPLYSTDFETGAGPAWSRGETATNTISARYLGEFANDTTTLLLAGLPPHSQLRLTWDAIILDTWEGNGGGPDSFGFNAAGLLPPAWEYTFHSSGNPLVQSYPGTPDVSFVNLGGLAGYNDSLYRNLRFDFAHTNDTLEVSFYGRNLEGVNNEGWGLDNFRVLMVSSSNGAFTGRFVIDKTPPQVAGITPSGTGILPVSQMVVTFNEAVQPQTVTTSTVSLRDVNGNAIALTAPVRLSATNFQFGFTSQRTNGTYTATIGPAILDLAGNAMAAPAVRTFNILTPPVIVTQPASQTIVRNNGVAFTVVANSTPPTSYQWTFNGAPITSGTNATLTLSNVQTNQSGAYAVTVTDAGGSVTSSTATLTVLQNYGPFVAQAQAARASLPVVPGNGVFIELFNGIGGGAAPTPALLSNVPPSGSTLSPVIDFPHPGSTISVGNTFNNFFQDTTTPPDAVLGLSAANFVLRHTFYLAISRTNDVHPETPEIDVRLGVGSDDGFYLLVGTNFLGSAGDRGFTYSWMDVSFEDEGLYPITLLYAANAVGQSGLEMSWQIGTNAATAIIPQRTMYISPDLGDRLITFEEVPPNTVLSNQYAATGVVFTAVSGAVRVTTNFPTRFVPVSPTRVFGDGTTNPASPGIVDITFVAPGTTNAATSDFVSFFIINAQNDAASVTAFGSGGQVLFTNTYHGGGAAQELASLNQRGIARIRLNLGQGTNTAAIDNLAFLTPASLPDLVADQLTVPGSVISGQPVQIVWRVTNQGLSPAQGPWTDTISLSTDAAVGNDQLLASVTYGSPLPVGASLTLTQSVIMPAGLSGDRWFVVTANAGHAFTESGSLTNNSIVAPAVTHVLAPDLAVQNLSAPGAAQFGQTLNVTWTVQNAGSTTASAPWSDRLYLSVSSNNLYGATVLATTPAPSSLAAGTSYTNSQIVALPLSASLAPGTYYLVLQADVDGVVADPNEQNNLLAKAIIITMPPLPDVVAGQVSGPAAALPGQTIPVSWTITNSGLATASGAWSETIYLSSDSVAANGNDIPLATFSFTNALPAATSLSRTQNVTLPLVGASGNQWLVVQADSLGEVVELNESNNLAVAAAPISIPVGLALSLPVSSVAEDTATPNLNTLVSRNGSLAAPVTVTLTSSDTNALRVPASVQIPAGQVSASFYVMVVHDNLPGTNRIVTIHATASGYAPVDAPLTVLETDQPGLVLSFPNGATTVEGGTLAALATRTGPTNQPVIVSVTTDNPTRLIPPTTVTIPAGATAAAFSFVAADDTVLAPDRLYTATISALGYSPASLDVTVRDNDTPTLLFTLSNTNVSEAAGAFATLATLQRSYSNAALLATPLTVSLDSAPSNQVVLPAAVSFASGQAVVTFPVGPIDNALLDGTRNVSLEARSLFPSINLPATAPIVARLTITDDEGPSLTLSAARSTLPEGTNALVTLTRNTPATNDLVVTLASSRTNATTLPPTVTIPTGTNAITFTAATINDGVPSGNKPVTLTASAAGFAPGAVNLTVTDINLPDIVVDSTAGPVGAFTKQIINLSFRIENQGLAAFTNTIRQRVYFSPTPTPSADTLVGEYLFNQANVAIGPGMWFEQSVAAFTPLTPGDYWVITVSDADNAVTELDKNNNTRISSQPVHVVPQYSATVSVLLPGKQALAGTPVPMHGTVTMADGQSPEGQIVNIHIKVRTIERVIAALARTDGTFDVTWRPLGTEAGNYTVGACHPGVTSAPVQDSFTLLGASFDPSSLALKVFDSGSVTSVVSLVNQGDVPLTGLTASALNVPGNLSVMPTLTTNRLGSMGVVSLLIAVAANGTTPTVSNVTVRVTSSEGVVANLPVNVTVVALRPQLTADPSSLEAGVARGQQKAVEFNLVNVGAAETGPITVSIPNAAWLSVASTNPLPSLAPGQTNKVVLLLTPGTNDPLGEFKGTLAVNGFGSSLPVPFTFRIVGVAAGNLEVTVEDEFTYYAAGAPRVAGATAKLLDGYSGSLIAQSTSDANGLASLAGVLEGSYLLRVTAPLHGSRDLPVTIQAGMTNKVRLLLPTETVAYSWTVVPTEVPDRYDLTVETKFETVVPFPVVTALKPMLVPVVIPGKVTQMSVTLTNHGLLAAKGVTMNPKSTPTYLITPLVREIGDIPARGSVTIPVMVQLQTNLDARIVAALKDQHSRGPSPNRTKDISVGFLDECDFPDLEVLYFVICGPDGVFHTVQIDLRPITMLEDLNGCIKSILENAEKGWAGLPGIACDCASTAAAAIGAALGGSGEVPKGIECLCAAIGLDPIGLAKCICFKVTPEPVTGEGGGGAIYINPVGFPGGDGIGCSFIPPTGPAPRHQAKDDSGPGICAQVKLRIEQQLVLTRSAFKATLQIENRLNDTSISNLFFRIDFFDALNQTAGSRFGVSVPTTTGFTALDGTGLLGPQLTGSAEFTIVPAADAAPTGQTPYTVGGELRYQQGTNDITITLQPVAINVLPQPHLLVDYFHQRDVYADDPFTDVVEPSVPYTLAVMLRNTGLGVARNVSISSSQPKIVENQKGLLIDFQLIGTELFDATGYRELTASLTANFGDLNAGDVKIGRWLLKSTLQGLFIDYSATFKHLDGLGNPALSLIGSNDVKIHELIHLVADARTGADRLPDFLVNDQPTQGSDSLPTSVYLSTGAVEPVNCVQIGTPGGVPTNGNLQITLTAPMPGGWAYLRVPDPQGVNGDRYFVLSAVRRSDGTNLPPENFWQTDRTFIGMGRKPIRENILHLLDYNATGSYTLTYVPAPGRDTTPPASSVAALPANVFPQFPVQWTGGDDGSGPLKFDIYVSVDNAPFALWLQGVSQLSATYAGTLGHSYAFYSVATDSAGNREAAHATPDATTSASLVNTAPLLTPAAGVTVNESDTVVLENLASDADAPGQLLTYSLGAGAPANAVISPSTGRITWPTSELDGPGTNFFTVIVTDSGVPPLSATGVVRVVVNEVNSAPILAPVANRTINEGQLLTITNVANDYDLPKNSLTFSLAANAPQGAAINATNGLFTWRPTSTQGPSTNAIAVVATDNGVPPLSATQQFSVIVRDVLSDVTVTLGSTNLMAGESGVVPVTLASSLDLTNLSFRIGATTNRLGSLALQPLAAEVTSAALLSLGADTYAASLTLDPALQGSSTRTVARLAFLAVSNVHSAVVPLTLSQLQAQRAGGQTVANTAGFGGCIIVVATEPVLEIGAGPRITLYGHPGVTAAFEYCTNLNGAPWIEFRRAPISDRVMLLSGLPTPGPVEFYRVYETPGFGLTLESLGGGIFALTLQGSAGASYTVQSATNLTVPVFWSDVLGVTLTNATQTFNWTNPGAQSRFFRLRQP